MRKTMMSQDDDATDDATKQLQQGKNKDPSTNIIEKVILTKVSRKQ